MFYRLRETKDKLPFWYDELGSFREEVVLKHKRSIPDIEDRLVVEKVNCVTLLALMRKHGVRYVDLLQMDLEGYDAHIIKSIDFGVFKPEMIRYENKHLIPSENEACVCLLKHNGYAIMKHDEGNTLAYLPFRCRKPFESSGRNPATD